MSASDSNPPAGFRLIPGFPRYAIDENGTVLSICGRGGVRGGGVHKSLPWNNARRLKPVTASRGHHVVTLHQDKNVRRVFVHVLVLTGFVGPCPNGLQCRHLDGNPTNNRVSNLVWGTPYDNQHDRIRHGTAGIGEKHSGARLTNDDVLEIRRRRAAGQLLHVLADAFHVTKGNIWCIVKRHTWKHI